MSDNNEYFKISKKFVPSYADETANNNAICIQHLMQVIITALPSTNAEIIRINDEWVRVQNEIDEVYLNEPNEQ